jgi:hypothetical protein
VSKRVWKFPLPVLEGDVFTIDMPFGADILTLQMQDRTPTLWALVDPYADSVSRQFRIAGTGHPIADKIRGYVGTFQTGGLVFHLFELL